MFCPQCKAEYRQGFTRCADCEINLVYELPVEAQTEPTDRRLVWQGDNAVDCAAACELLQDAGIPYNTSQRTESFYLRMQAIWKFEVFVEASEYDRARESLGLNDEGDPGRDAGSFDAESRASGTKFCPLCTAEFREGFTQCNECRVALVGTRAEAEAVRVSLWKGERPQELDRILSALASDEIASHYKESLSSVPRVQFGRMFIRAKFEYEVWVFRRDLERAKIAIREEEEEPGN